MGGLAARLRGRSWYKLETRGEFGLVWMSLEVMWDYF